MTESSQRAAMEPYTTAFETTVAAVDGREVELDETYFYAESGGQPADRGTIGGVAVTDVRSIDGRTVHVLDDEPDLHEGDSVACEIESAFRTYCMRAHTASHVLYGAGRNLLDDLGYAGFDIGERKVRVDFETSTPIDDAVLVELEQLTNRVVWEGREVTWRDYPKAEAIARDDIAFNSATEEGVMADADAVRIVEIDGWDVAACGGTHVRRTSEIGPVSVLDRSNPGEGVTRVEFAVGPRAIEHRATIHAGALEAARVLDVGVADLPSAVGRQADRLAELERELRELEARAIDARLSTLGDRAETIGDERWVIGTVDGVDTGSLADRVRGGTGELGDVVVLLNGDDDTTVVVGSSGSSSANDVVDRITTQFGGGGGGSETFAQGGGIGADPADVISYLRET